MNRWAGLLAGALVVGGLTGTPAAALQDQEITTLEEPPASVEVGENWLIQGRASSGLPVTYRVLTPSTCDDVPPPIDPNFEVWGVSAGECRVRITQAGNAVYAPTSKVVSTSIVKASTYTIINTFTKPGHEMTNWFAPGEPFDVEISVVRQNDDPGSYATITGDVNYRVDDQPRVTTALQRVDGTNRVDFTVPGLAAGTHEITADFAGSDKDAPSNAYMHALTVNRVSTLDIDVQPTVVEVGTKTTITVQVGLRDNPGPPVPTGSVSMSAGDHPLGDAPLDNTGRASLVTRALPAGHVDIEVSYPGDSETTPADETIFQDVSKGYANAAVLGPKGYLVGDDMDVVLAAQVPPGWPTPIGTFTLWVQPINGGAQSKVGDYALKAGEAEVTITQHLPAGDYIFFGEYNGDDNYEQSSAPIHPFQVLKYEQEIRFVQPDPMHVGQKQALAVVSDAGLPVTVTSLTPATCSTEALLGGSRVIAVASGTCTLRATQDGTDEVEPAEPVQRTLEVTKKAQKISFAQPSAMQVGASQTLRVSSDAEPIVTVTSLTPDVCSVEALFGGDSVKALAAGTCILRATQDGTADVDPAAPVQHSLTVTRHEQTLHLSMPDSLAVGQTQTVHANASSGLAVTLTSQTPAVCTIAGAKVTGVAAGTCVVSAHQDGNAKWAAAPQVTGQVGVNRQKQQIQVTLAKRVKAGKRTAVMATSSSGLVVKMGTTTPKRCKVTKIWVKGLKKGTCKVTATQAGNGSWAPAATVTKTVTVKR